MRFLAQEMNGKRENQNNPSNPIPLNDEFDEGDEEMKIQSAFWKVCLVSIVMVGSGYAEDPKELVALKRKFGCVKIFL